MRRPRAWALALLVAAAGCSDQLTTPVTPPYTLDPSRTIDPQGSLDEEIQLLSDALFPRGLETAAGTRWDNVKAKYAAGLADPSQMRVARQMLFELARWVGNMTGQMETPPYGESRASAAARLVGYMALYVHHGPGTDVPPFNPEADAVVGFVSPTEATTVVTPLKLAGIGFDAGSVSEPMVVTIVQNPQQYPLNCTGPLTTPRCQYPLFYEFDFYPAQRLLKPAHGSVCHVLEGRPRRPLDAATDETEPVHTRMALAHTLPADPGNYTPGATQYYTPGPAPDAPPVENIEVLPLSTQAVKTSGTMCDTDPYYTFEERSDLLGRLAFAVEKVIRPTPLYAVDQGPEWDFVFASPFNYVDVAGAPDASVGAASVAGSSTTEGTVVAAGGTASVSYTVFNVSPVNGGLATATAPATTARIYLSADAVRDPADVLLGTVPVPELVPDASHTETAVAVTIPGTTGGGAYYVITEIPATGLLADANTANNVVALPISVQAPVPLTATPLGTVLNAGSGTPTIDGSIGANEWGGSECGSITANTPQGGTTTAVLCAKNDATHMYFVYQLVRDVDDPGRSFGAELDTDGDGEIGLWDDGFVSNPAIGLADNVRVSCETTVCGASDADAGGQVNGSAAYAFHGNYAVHEVAKPLASGDGRDVSLMPGDAVQLRFFARVLNGPNYPADYGDTDIPAAGMLTLQLSGSTSIPNPVLAYTGSVQYTTESGDYDRYSLDVTNRTLIPDALFDPMPGLAACGQNTEAARTWVDILDAAGQRIYGFCALEDADDLASIWFGLPRWVEPSSAVSVRLNDRLRNLTYVSNQVPLFGPEFNHFPRTLELSWPAVDNAVSYDVEVDYGDGCTTGDWRTCTATWNPQVRAGGVTATSYTFSFVGMQQGRWRVIARNASGAVVGTTAYKYFLFRI